MSWADGPRRPPGVRFAVAAAGLAAALGLGACQVQPLYAEQRTATGEIRPGPAAELAQVQVESPGNRVEQLVHNELVFLFTGGSDPPPPHYLLRYVTNTDQEALAVEREGNLPTQILVTVQVTFVLEEIETGRTLLTGTSFQTGTYTFSSQRFANVAGLRDAEKRAAEAVAENMALRLAAFFKARAA